jgi:hypothetical protein
VKTTTAQHTFISLSAMLQPPAIQATIGRGTKAALLAAWTYSGWMSGSPDLRRNRYSQVWFHLTKDFGSTLAQCEQVNQHPCRGFQCRPRGHTMHRISIWGVSYKTTHSDCILALTPHWPHPFLGENSTGLDNLNTIVVQLEELKKIPSSL